MYLKRAYFIFTALYPLISFHFWATAKCIYLLSGDCQKVLIPTETAVIDVYTNPII